MIKIGMTTFKEHGSLLDKKNLVLEEYAAFFPIVELATSFYSIPSLKNSQQWIEKTPASFLFIFKAHQAMTKHISWQKDFTSEEEMFNAFFSFIELFIKSDKLASVLFQFPATFTCNKENVDYLRKIREYYPDMPISIEFRNSSWYHEKMKDSMINFMKTYHYSLVMVDEPQIANHSVPFDTTVTNKDFAYVRLHGRNKGNWLDNSEEWRSKRTLYCYSNHELQELAEQLKNIQATDIAVIFNNNSDRDAAPNGMTLKKILDVEYHGLHPNQTSLF